MSDTGVSRPYALEYNSDHPRAFRYCVKYVIIIIIIIIMIAVETRDPGPINESATIFLSNLDRRISLVSEKERA